MPTTERAARLFRVSTNGQTEENQVPEVDAHCQANGYKVARTFELHDISGTGEQEEVLEEILADIKAGLYSVVVVAHSSRIDRRDPDTQAWYLLSIRRAGGRVESVREPEFGKPTLSGRLNTTMSQHQNWEYVETLKAHTAAGKRAIKVNGALDGRPPWGYAAEGEKKNKRMVPTGIGRRYVPLIYGKVISGLSAIAVAEWLDAEGVPPSGIKSEDNPKGKAGRWWARSVLQIVKNPAYKGMRCARTGSTTWADTPLHRCEPLVDAGTWKRANDAVKTRPKRGPVSDNRAMLATAVTCGEPGCTAGPDSPMYKIRARGNGDGREYFYYRCTGRGAGRKGCGNMVPLHLADRAVDALVSAKFTHPVLARRLVPGNAAELDAKLDDIKAEIAELGTRGLSDEEYDAELKRLRKLRDDTASAERTEDSFELLPTGDIYSALWDGLEPAQRGTWLRSQGIAVRLTRQGAAVAQDVPWTGDEPPESVLPMLPKQADLAPGGGRVAHFIRFADLDAEVDDNPS
jgi:DNA invertase Pin-like site-specific DNA recombinase